MLRIISFLATMASLLFLIACAPGEPVLDSDDPNYDRFEGTSHDNDCATDNDCVVGGCSNETCAAEPVASTCEAIDVPDLGSCGCHRGECRWLD